MALTGVGLREEDARLDVHHLHRACLLRLRCTCPALGFFTDSLCRLPPADGQLQVTFRMFRAHESVCFPGSGRIGARPSQLRHLAVAAEALPTSMPMAPSHPKPFRNHSHIVCVYKTEQATKHMARIHPGQSVRRHRFSHPLLCAMACDVERSMYARGLFKATRLHQSRRHQRPITQHILMFSHRTLHIATRNVRTL